MLSFQLMENGQTLRPTVGRNGEGQGHCQPRDRQLVTETREGDESIIWASPALWLFFSFPFQNPEFILIFAIHISIFSRKERDWRASHVSVPDPVRRTVSGNFRIFQPPAAGVNYTDRYPISTFPPFIALQHKSSTQSGEHLPSPTQATHHSPLSIFSSGLVPYSSGTTSSPVLKSIFLIVASHLSCARLHHRKCCKYSSLEYTSIL